MDDNGNPKKQRIVYAIVEKPGLKKAVWIKLGVAYVNQDQSINVYLDALPYGGKLQIREEELKPRQAGGEARAPSSLPSTFDVGGSIQ
ncbi:MAG TPA: hypothetical protein VF997_06710 [Polyangia bacterium]